MTYLAKIYYLITIKNNIDKTEYKVDINNLIEFFDEKIVDDE